MKKKSSDNDYVVLKSPLDYRIIKKVPESSDNSTDKCGHKNRLRLPIGNPDIKAAIEYLYALEPENYQ